MAVALALIAGPLMVVGLLAAARRTLAGTGWLAPPPPEVCRRCGYDLRATPDRCPECGAERFETG